VTAAHVVAWLRKKGARRHVQAMARYGIIAKRPIGVQMGTLLVLKKRLGRDQALSLALWKSGWYEARLLAALIGDPARVTSRQMDAWARDFENWADCDTACFHLFDRTPLAWIKARLWVRSPREFVRRGGYALMASLALHDKTTPDARFLPFLPIIERGAKDERNFVKKGVSWALRGIGHRSPKLRAAALKAARRLASSDDAARRWVGKDALRDLTR
jgi:3-methyladenine DNA glycosylase AlkD